MIEVGHHAARSLNMITKANCQEVIDLSYEFANGTLPDEQRLVVERHLQTCAACNEKLSQFCAVQGTLQNAVGPEVLSPNFKEATGKRVQALGSGSRPAANDESFLPAAPA